MGEGGKHVICLDLRIGKCEFILHYGRVECDGIRYGVVYISVVREGIHRYLSRYRISRSIDRYPGP